MRRLRRLGPGYVLGVGVAAVALFFVGKGLVGGVSTDTAAAHLHQRAGALCAAGLPEINRIVADEHVAQAAHVAGKISSAGLAARYQADLVAGSELERRVANQIAALPGARSDATLPRVVAFLGSVARVTRSEAFAAGRSDQSAVQAYAARLNRLVNANAGLAGVCAGI